jgi:hypothetical protein
LTAGALGIAACRIGNLSLLFDGLEVNVGLAGASYPALFSRHGAAMPPHPEFTLVERMLEWEPCLLWVENIALTRMCGYP